VLTQLAVKARSRQPRDEIDLHLYEAQRFDEQRGCRVKLSRDRLTLSATPLLLASPRSPG
jgi:hypothetical protein